MRLSLILSLALVAMPMIWAQPPAEALNETGVLEQELECEDTIESHPLCLFGGLCDCEEVTSGANPCGSSISSPMGMGSVSVNEICAATCGCVEVPSVNTPCEDELANHPLCTFAQLCSCQGDVLANPNYECGGDITSPQGSVAVNDVCRLSCNACDEIGVDEDPGPAYPGPVFGHLPMGSVDGKRSDLYYNVTEDQVSFELIFPDSLIWIAFQFWSTSDFVALTDGRLTQATSGYECLVHNLTQVTSESRNGNGNGIECRARRIRHMFTRWADLPGPSDAVTDPFSVSVCNDERSMLSVKGTPYCQYDPKDVTRTSLIISSTSGSELVFVTDVLHADEMTDMTVDMSNVEISTLEGGYIKATWSRTRAYPWRIEDGPSLRNRWATSPRGASGWFEGDLQYHGATEAGRWLVGNDRFFVDPVALQNYYPQYVEDIHANTEIFSEAEIQAKLAAFRSGADYESTMSAGDSDMNMDATESFDGDGNTEGEEEEEASAGSRVSSALLLLTMISFVLLS